MTVAGAPAPPAAANMRQLVALRWIAIAGQVTTILVVHLALGVPLPLPPMLAALAVAVTVNLASLAALRRERVGQRHLLPALLFDLALLTVQLALSGGIANPFVPLFLLQVGLGATLLDRRSSWLVALAATASFALLTVAHAPLVYPPAIAALAPGLVLAGAFLCFVLVATLLVLFVTRISANLRAQDAHLADLRRRAVEEEHIVRMGLLASGAAHELGTPLATLAVILADWRRMLPAPGEQQADIADMRGAVERCKTIVGGILRSVGEARGEAPEVVSLQRFVDDMADAWRQAHPAMPFIALTELAADALVVADRSLRQAVTNLLDNAVEAGATQILFEATRDAGTLRLTVRDDGRGFTPDMLANIGQPYRTSKSGHGHGLGLFLASNVMRTLGGTVSAANRRGGGAEVTLALPLAAICLTEETGP